MIERVVEVLNTMPRYRMLRICYGNQETGEDSLERAFGMVRRDGLLYSLVRTVRSPHVLLDIGRVVCISSAVGRPTVYWAHPGYVKPIMVIETVGPVFCVGGLQSFPTEKKAIQWARRMDFTLVSSKPVLTSSVCTPASSGR